MAETMTKLTYIGRFVRGEEELFETTMFAGYVGVMTGQKKNAFAVSLNTRKPSWRSDYSILFWNLVNLF